MSDKVNSYINAFSSSKWTERRDAARSASALLNSSVQEGWNSQKLLWDSICTGNEDVRYWSKRVLEKSATLDFFIALLEDEEIRNDSDKSRDLFELFNYRYTEMYPYLLAHFSYFNRENKLNLIQLLVRNGDSGLLDFFGNLNLSADSEIKQEAIGFLSRFHTRESLEGLFSFLGDDSFQIKARAASALSKSFEFLELEDGTPRFDWFLPRIQAKIKDRFITTLGSGEPGEMLSILEDTDTAGRFLLLRLLPDDDRLISFFLDQPLAEFQLLVLLCFKDAVTARFRDTLMRFLSSEFNEIREIALSIAREANIPVDAGYLADLLQTADQATMKTALDLTALSPDKDLFEPVLKLTEAQEPGIRFFSLYPLAQFYRYEQFRETIFCTLTSCFSDSYWPVRNQASLCFKYLGEEVSRLLLDLLDSETGVDSLYWTVITLGQFNDENITAPLLSFYAKTDEYSLKKAVVEVLGNFPCEETAGFFRSEILKKDMRSVVLRSLHHLSAEQIEDIISAGKVSDEELPSWIKMRKNKDHSNGD